MPTLEENRGARLLLVLSKVSQSLQSARSPGDVYKKFGESIHELGFEATILSLDDSGKYLTTTYQSREPEKINRFSRRLGFSVNDYPVPIRNNGILDQAVNAGRTIFLESRAEILLKIFPKGVRPLIKPMVTKYGKDMHSIIAPLRFDEKTFGVMGVSGADLGEIEIPAITVFAGQVSTAIMNTHTYTALQEREEEKFRIIFESAPDAYYINDLKGNFIDGNKQAERITGYNKEELIGKSFLKLNLLPKNQLPKATALLAKNVLGRPTGPDEFTLIRKNGSKIEVEIDTHPVNIAGKTVVLGIARDITERKQAEEALQESVERYRTTFESVNDAIIRLNKSGKIIDINDRVTDIFGYTRDEVIGKNFSKLGIFSPKDLLRVLKLFGKAVTGDVEEILVWPIRHKNGTMIPVEASASLVKKNDKVDGVVAFIRDITERKRAEETLREQAETIRSIVDSSQDWIWAIDLQGIHTYSNPAIEHILGYQSDELVGKPSFDLMHEEDRQMIATEMPRWISEKRGWRGLVIRMRHRDGRWRYLESSAVPIIDANGQIVGFRGVDRDITERKHMEEAEQEQRMLAEALAVTAAAINSTLDVDAVLEGILDGIRSVLPYDAADISLIEGDEIRITASRGYDEFETHNLRNLTIPLDQTPHSLRMVETAQPEVVEDVQDDTQWVTNGVFNGIGKWIRAYAGAPIVVDGFVVGFIHLNSKQPAMYNGKAATWLKAFADQAAVALRNAQLYQELEEHSEQLEFAIREATQDLRDAKERVETILGNSPDAILLLSPLGTIRLGNKAFENLFGYSAEEAQGRSLCSVMTDTSLQECNRVLQTLIDHEEAVRVELTISGKEGSARDAELALSPIMVEGDLQGIVASIRDITALKQVERMKDAFVSNVSHELRTPITSLRLNHNLLKREPGERKYLDRFDREITRLNQLIEDLLRLSRLDQGQVELNLEAVDLNDLMVETTQDRVALAESHELELVLICQEAHIPPVQADANLLGQVLSVLLTNAIQYTPAGGHIDVCAVHEQRDGARWVGFRVRDDGLGISSDDLSHLFERFYRGTVGRKSGSPGTGLGLSIASEIVQRHRGHIEVKSKGIPGEGTTFTVLLPVANGSDRSVKGD
jgi:PAS domain S-box-containing protein